MSSMLGRYLVVLLLANPVTAAVYAQNPPAGTLQLGNLPEGAREAVLAAIDARQRWQFMAAHEHVTRALSIDSTFGLARVVRVDLSGGPTAAWVNAEYQRGSADAAARPIGEGTYLSAIRAAGANANRLLGVARAMMPNDRRVALDHALSFLGSARLDSLRAMVERHPDFLAPRIWLAFYLAPSAWSASPAELYEAYVVASEAARLAPNDAAAHTVVGHTLTRLGRFEEAAQHLEAATRLDRRAEYAYDLLGEVYVRDGRPGGVDRARAALDSAIAVNPNHLRRINQRRERAFLLFYDGRKAEGFAELSAVAKEYEAGAPGTAAVVYSQMAGLAAGVGDTGAVEPYMAEARRVAPNANVTVQAVQAYGLARQPVAARREFNEFLRRSTDTTTSSFRSNRHRLSGMVLLAEGKPAEALAELKQSDLRENPFAELAMMDAYLMQNNRTAASATLAALVATRTLPNSAISYAIANYRAHPSVASRNQQRRRGRG